MARIGTMTAVNAKHLLGTIAASLDTVINREQPLLEGELLLDGSRVAGTLPPIVENPSFAIRKKASSVFPLDQYVEREAMNKAQREAILAAIRVQANILVAGGTSSGKTTLANAVIHGISTRCPQDRVLIIEDTAEIQCEAENALIFRANSEVDMLRLLRISLRYQPDRILVGEVRGPEALALLKAWNTGHPGGVATIHANSAEAALIRLEQLVAEAGAVGMSPLIAVYRGANRSKGARDPASWLPRNEAYHCAYVLWIVWVAGYVSGPRRVQAAMDLSHVSSAPFSPSRTTNGPSPEDTGHWKPWLKSANMRTFSWQSPPNKPATSAGEDQCEDAALTLRQGT